MQLNFIPYDLARALHIISFTAWMAALLMLPRLMAYQSGAISGGELDQKMGQAISRLRAIIMTPALLATWVCGLYLLAAYSGAMASTFWLSTKLVLVVGLTAFHGWLIANAKKIAKGQRPHSERFWRMVNEVPFVIAIAIILLATLEPNWPSWLRPG